MTTELVLLISLFVFVIGSSLFGPRGPFKVFGESGPRLTARVEQHITTGSGFSINEDHVKQKWTKPEGAPPGGPL